VDLQSDANIVDSVTAFPKAKTTVLLEAVRTGACMCAMAFYTTVVALKVILGEDFNSGNETSLCPD